MTYNNDLQCGYPFAALTIEDMVCTPQSYYTFGDYDQSEAYQYQDYEEGQQQQQGDYNDGGENNGEDGQYYQQQPGTCLAGEIMDVSGQLTIENEKVSKYFDVTLKMCWTKWNMNFKCETHTEKVDLGYFALSEEQQEENQQYQEEQQEQEQQQYENEENGQANNPYYWYNPYKNKYSSESMYLYPGTYDYTIRVTIPDNSYTESGMYVCLFVRDEWMSGCVEHVVIAR